MDELVRVFDDLMDRLTQQCTENEKMKLKRTSCKVHYMRETFQYGLYR